MVQFHLLYSLIRGYCIKIQKIKEKGEKAMARLPMVTRTITTTKVNVLCLDIEHAEPCNKVVTIPRTYKDEETILKKVKPLLETESLKVVHVVDTETEETLYGMTEQEFVELANPLLDRTGKTEEATEPETENE